MIRVQKALEDPWVQGVPQVTSEGMENQERLVPQVRRATAATWVFQEVVVHAVTPALTVFLVPRVQRA